MSDDLYSFRPAPTYKGATKADLMQSAFEQPMSKVGTFGDQVVGGALESYGLGTAIRDAAIPAGTEPTGIVETATRLFTRSPLVELGINAVQSMRADSPGLDEAAYKESAHYRPNIPWDRGMTEARAASLAEWDDAKKVREHYASLRPFSAFAGNVVGQAFDPINYIPVAGPVVKAAAVARTGRIGGAAIAGSVDAAGNTALAAVATRDARAKYGDDVSWQTTVSEIATAALIGGAFGSIGGALEVRGEASRQKQAQASLGTLKATQEARIALNEAIDGLVQGGDINLTPNGAGAVQRMADRIPGEYRSAVGPQMRDRLQTAGRSVDEADASAAIFDEAYSTFASRHGMNVDDLIDMVGLPEVRKGASAEQRVAQGVLQQGDEQTPAFRNWFGESKAVDEGGKPQVFYHGSTSPDVDQFKSKDGAYYFSRDPKTAAGAERGFLDPDDFKDFPELVEKNGVPEGLNLTPVYLKMENPASIDDVRRIAPDVQNIREAFPALKEAGYDGFVSNYETAVFDPTQIKSVNNRGTYDPADPRLLFQSSQTPLVDAGDHADRISTRYPTQARSTEDPVAERLVVDTASMKAIPAAFEHNMGLVAQYPGMPDTRGMSADEIADTVKQHAKDNLRWLYDQVPPDVRNKSKRWYDGARRIVDEWQVRYGLPDRTLSGVLASLSPQKDWYQNVSLAERVLDAVGFQGNTAWSPEMNAKVDEIFAKPAHLPMVAAVRGKTLNEIPRERYDLQALWVRAYDEAHNDRRYREVSADGAFIDEPKGVAAWGSLVEIAKAIAVIRDPSYANISGQMGAMHKVRNFFNNILAPRSKKGDVTIDTHAVAAALLRPLSGSSTEVFHNFGSSPMKAKQPADWKGAAKDAGVSGSRGTYGLLADAYRELADELGILPRELQSITWEAVRGLFPAKFKQAKKNVAAADAIWKSYSEGDITADQARKKIDDLSGGIQNPSWYRPGDGRDDSGRGTSYERGIPGQSVPDWGAGPAAGRDRGEPSDDTVDVTLDQSGRGRDGGSAVAGEAGQADGRAEPARVEPLSNLYELYPKSVGPSPQVMSSKENYLRSRGLPMRRQAEYANVDPARAKRIADAFDEMQHSPDDPATIAAYRAMVDETVAQFRQLEKDLNLKIEFIKPGQVDPYKASPRMALEDVKENGHLWVFPTDQGFGSAGPVAGNNPLLEPTDVIVDGKQLLANDVFRIVHDIYGHGPEGAGFGPVGEENAWQSHVRMYSPEAARAMTTETRGQNSWVNYGPLGEKNRANPKETTFADQKMGLLPEWVMSEGVVKDAPVGRDQAGVTYNQDQTSTAGPRGSVEFSPTGKTVITLFERADPSTALHESGHVFLDIFKKLAEREGAPAGITKDWQQVKDWWSANADAVAADGGEGISAADVRQALDTGTTGDRMKDIAVDRGLHEQWARAFETYLRDGVAPTERLKGVFEQFKDWLTKVYKKAQQLNVNMTPELRGVFDRMLGAEAVERGPSPTAGQPTRAAGRGVDLSNPPPEPAPEGLETAAASIGKPEDARALAEQYGVDPTTGDFAEMEEVAQLREMGKLTAEDEAALAIADEGLEQADAYAKALKAALFCTL